MKVRVHKSGVSLWPLNFRLFIFVLALWEHRSYPLSVTKLIEVFSHVGKLQNLKIKVLYSQTRGVAVLDALTLT